MSSAPRQEKILRFFCFLQIPLYSEGVGGGVVFCLFFPNLRNPAGRFSSESPYISFFLRLKFVNEAKMVCLSHFPPATVTVNCKIVSVIVIVTVILTLNSCVPSLITIFSS